MGGLDDVRHDLVGDRPVRVVANGDHRANRVEHRIAHLPILVRPHANGGLLGNRREPDSAYIPAWEGEPLAGRNGSSFRES